MHEFKLLKNEQNKMKFIKKIINRKNLSYYIHNNMAKAARRFNLIRSTCPEISINELCSNSNTNNKTLNNNYKIMYLTFLNSGCLSICLNMLESANKVGIKKNNFIIACMDKKVFNYLLSNGYEKAFLYLDQNLTEYQEWSSDDKSGFRNIIKHKWMIINKVHKEFPNLIWIDTDIVIKSNPTNILRGHKKILFQSDLP